MSKEKLNQAFKEFDSALVRLTIETSGNPEANEGENSLYKTFLHNIKKVSAFHQEVDNFDNAVALGKERMMRVWSKKVLAELLYLKKRGYSLNPELDKLIETTVDYFSKAAPSIDISKLKQEIEAAINR